MNTQGLKERLSKAASVKEVEGLLAEGATYKAVSPETARKWNRVSKAHIAFLSKPKPAAAPVVAPPTSKKQPITTKNHHARR